MMRAVLFTLLIACCANAFAEQELNVYNWSDFIPDTLIHQFEKETGIKVNYSTYDSNEALFAKLKASGQQSYDVIFPSNYFIQRMIRQNMLQPLDLTKLSNLKNLDQRFLNLPYDPHNHFSLPYLWSTTAIMVNKKYIDPNTLTRWQDLWQPQFKNQLLLLDDTRDVFSMGLIANGLSPNTTNTQQIETTFQKLKTLLPNVRLFNSIAQTNIYLDEDTHLGMVWSGEASIAEMENTNLVYIFPKEGFVIELDCMAITKNAPHQNEAYQFIDFLMRPDIARQIVESTHFMAPNKPMVALLPKNIRESKTVNPDPSTLKRGKFLTDIGETTEIYEKFWQRLKVAG